MGTLGKRSRFMDSTLFLFYSLAYSLFFCYSSPTNRLENRWSNKIDNELENHWPNEAHQRKKKIALPRLGYQRTYGNNYCTLWFCAGLFVTLAAKFYCILCLGKWINLKRLVTEWRWPTSHKCTNTTPFDNVFLVCNENKNTPKER